jgi:hypothetical protein
MAERYKKGEKWFRLAYRYKKGEKWFRLAERYKKKKDSLGWL